MTHLKQGSSHNETTKKYVIFQDPTPISTKQKAGIYFENVETMRKIITEERIRVIHVVKKEHPSSIYALAKLLDRDPKNVSDDVHYLAQVGLLELKKTKEGREKTTPKVGYSKILVEIPV